MSRETAYVALFAKLQTLSGSFALISRRLQLLEAVDKPKLPALFMTVGKQTVVPRPGVPPRRTLGAEVFIYAASPDDKVASGILLNTLIDTVEACLAPLPYQVQQTLGGVVAHAWIEGAIDVYEAVKTQRAAALIPVTMLMP